MDRQTRFLGRLVDDLLDVSRLDSGKVRLMREVVDLKETVERCLASFHASGALRDRVVTSDLESTWVSADATRLVQVINNLLENAAKFTVAGGCIHVRVEASAEEAVVRILDDGRGIDSRTLPHIFDFFAQADDALDRSHGGLGIGLTVVRRLVELHGGSVEAQSEGVGQGSEFVLHLPVRRAPFDTERTKAATEATPAVPEAGPPAKYIFSIDRQSHVLRRLEFPLHPRMRKDYEDRGAKEGLHGPLFPKSDGGCALS